MSAKVLTIQQMRICQACDDIKKLLLQKSESYGDSVSNPVNIFSQASAEEQLCSSIDHKLARIMRQGRDDIEDSLADTIGYMILLQVERTRG